MAAEANFDWIVPINTTAADTKDPGFYLVMYSIVAACLTYLFFATIATDSKRVLDVTQKGTKGGEGYQIKLTDMVLFGIFGFVLLLTMYAYAWGGYINVVLYQYAPNNGTRGQYPLQLTQDLYGLGLSSIGLFYGTAIFFQRVLAYVGYSNWGYFFRVPMAMLAILSFVMLPGVLSYRQNGGLFNAGSWMILLMTILISTHVAALFVFLGVRNEGDDNDLFPTIVGLVRKNDGASTIFLKGMIPGFRTDLTFLVALMFYEISSEMLIYGDLIKVAASFFVGWYLVGLMTALTKKRASFMSLHIIAKTYFIVLNYWLEYVRTPIPTTQEQSLVIDKNIVDVCAFTTGPSYYTMNTYGTSFQVYAGLGFGFSCVLTFVTFMLPSFISKLERRYGAVDKDGKQATGELNIAETVIGSVQRS